MSEHLKEASYPGQIEIGRNRQPVTYKLTASKKDGGAYHVEISVMAPRDWLLKQGFDREAALLRDGGDAIPVRMEDTLDVDDNISVTLRAEDAVLSSLDELNGRFPELRRV